MMDNIRKEFNLLSALHYKIVQQYIMSKVNIEEYEKFKKELFAFRDKIDCYKPVDENELYEIASIKSRIQHYITDTIEDENILNSMF